MSQERPPAPDKVPWLVRLIWGNGTAEELRRVYKLGSYKPKSKTEKETHDAKNKEKEKEKDATSGIKEVKSAVVEPSKFTKEQDEKLAKFKSENQGKPWKDICTQMGLDEKFAGELKARYKAISEATKEKPDTKKDKKQPETKDTRDKATKNDDSKEKAQNGGKKKDDETLDLKPDEDFSAEELKVLVSVLHQDGEDRWLRIASRFYDLTGRRIHEDDVKRKLTKG